MIHNPNPNGRGAGRSAQPARPIPAALTPNPDTPPGDPMPEHLRPGPPVDMSPEAVAARRAQVLKQMRDGNAAWLRKQAADRGELPYGEDDDR